MKLTIKSEKYINADPPVLTEEMLDWLYLTMFQSFIRKGFDDIKSIDKIDIIANTAYNGSSTVHFYITINDIYKFHKEYTMNLDIKYQTPSLWTDNYYRDEWLRDFIEYGGIYCGIEGDISVKKYEDRIQKEKLKEERKKAKKRKEERYKLYLELKKEFE